MLTRAAVFLEPPLLLCRDQTCLLEASGTGAAAIVLESFLPLRTTSDELFEDDDGEMLFGVAGPGPRPPNASLDAGLTKTLGEASAREARKLVSLISREVLLELLRPLPCCARFLPYTFGGCTSPVALLTPVSKSLLCIAKAPPIRGEEKKTVTKECPNRIQETPGLKRKLGPIPATAKAMILEV